MKRNSWIRRGALLALALCFALLSGCSLLRRNREASAPTAEPTAAPTETPEPAQGGTLRLPMPVNSSFSDPFDVESEEMLNLFSLMFDKLLTVSTTGELEPCLCESWTDEGGGSWLLRLRDGVKWHNGKGFTAGDVLFTYNSLLEAESSYYKPCLKHIESIEEVDSLTLRAKLDVPGIMGLYSFVFPVKCEDALVGTGAYRLERRDDTSIWLRVNGNWWDKLPYIENIVYVERDSTQTALASFEAGQLDMVPADVLTAGKYAELGVTDVYDVMTQNMEVLLFNHETSVFASRGLRLAVAHAINRSRIITNVYMNRARLADSPFPPDSWLNSTRSGSISYSTDQALGFIEDEGYTVISEAEKGLRYSRSGSSLAVRLLTSGTTDNTVRSDAASMIASQLAELGFQVEVIVKEHKVGDPDSPFLKALNEGEWDMALAGFSLGLGNELSSYIEPDGSNNFGRFTDIELVTLANRMLLAGDEEALREAAYAVQDCFIANVPFIVLYFRLNSIICSADIHGVTGAREPLIFEDIKNWYIAK